MARSLAHEPKRTTFDEPTRGADARAIAELRRAIDDATAKLSYAASALMDEQRRRTAVHPGRDPYKRWFAVSLKTADYNPWRRGGSLAEEKIIYADVH